MDKEKDDCPLCQVSDETIEKLKKRDYFKKSSKKRSEKDKKRITK